jgi:hypothetical protein
MFKMIMGSKSQTTENPYAAIIKAMSPLSLDECGTPTTPPCGVERKLGSTSTKGEKDGVTGTFTTTNFQTDFKIPGTPSSSASSHPGSGGAFSNPKLPNQTYEEFQAADWGTPGKTHIKYKPAEPSYGETMRSDTNFVPDPPTPPKETPTPILPPPYKGEGKGSNSLTIGKIKTYTRGRGKKKNMRKKYCPGGCNKN